MDASMLEELTAAHPPEPFVRTMARLAEEDTEFVALTCGEESITRRGLEQRSNRLARVYLDRGVAFGDYVVVALPNGIEFYVAFFAALKVGAVPMPLSYRLPPAERQAIVDMARPALLVGVDPADHPGYGALAPGFEPDPALSDEPLPEVVSPSWKAPASGGSTGRPKIIRNGTGAEGSPALGAFVYEYGPDDTQAVVGPLYHNMSLASSVGGLLLGQHVVVMRRFDPEELLTLIARHRVTWLTVVPTMMHRMLRVIQAGGEWDLSSVRLMYHMSSKCPEWLKEAWIDLIGPEKIVEIYGGTEAVGVTRITGTEWLRHRGSVGRPLVGEMKVLDDNGDEAPHGVVGEIYMKRADGMPSSYEYVGAEAKRRNGWETLGDLGWKDEDGYLYISDRRVDMIVSGGANVYPAEVEAAIDEHPKVLSSVVVGLPDDDLVTRVHALVQAAPGTTEQEILNHLSERLVRYKVPRSIEFIDQPLRDDSGKVRRGRMRDEAIERMKQRASRA
ncbi:AMP-binding protein [Actinomadura madurae]|uniref:AMP-binding protein n=1 Tax=Actinomadura madurae TaxID=1993 RepID=UPI0020266E98|nr:AMP-binding protein [Actinomadura madurae]MCP9949931.1 AMP-binding protein [Actinomadura madurae]MCP9966689.1 AMP-binding protein [Actinomadura madurae]MCP9979176.1 AMP-binding protein [Actinomadura madurae]MCQ0009295.1 AMP-binding protein [Actinomadura madurae]MCQ0015364.1 AMP-binding protein [Actinomadura madurae]